MQQRRNRQVKRAVSNVEQGKEVSVLSPNAKKSSQSVGGLKGTEEAAIQAEKGKLDFTIDKLVKAIQSGQMSADDIASKLGVSITRSSRVHRLPSGDVVFEYIDIPAVEVKAKTVISKLNTRYADMLTREDVEDVIETLDGGILGHPVYAVLNKDGVYEIIDGSRRHAAHGFCEDPPNFSTWYTKTPLTSEDIDELSKIWDAKLEHSAHEQGTHWNRLLEEGKYQ